MTADALPADVLPVPTAPELLLGLSNHAHHLLQPTGV